MNNELIKQRLSCIPIHIQETDFPIEDYEIEIDKKNDSDTIQYVTTENFRIKDITSDSYLSESATRKIFPPDPITGDYIIFCRLKPRISTELPGEEIDVEAKLSIRTADENSSYNVTSTCAYGMTVDKFKQDSKWQEIKDKIITDEMKKESIEIVKQNWYNHEGKRHVIEGSYDFILETVGIYTNDEIMKLACDILVDRLTKLMNSTQQDELNISKSISTIKHCYDIILPDIDYTIGKIVEYMLNEKFYKSTETKNLSYIGFVKLHPHDSHSIIRMAFMDEEGDMISLFKQNMMNSCKLCIDIFKDIKDDFA